MGVKNNNTYHDIVESYKKGSDICSMREYYDITFAAFMIADYSLVDKIIDEVIKLYPEETWIYDIRILSLWEQWEFDEVCSILEKYSLDSYIICLVKAKILEYKGEVSKSWNIYIEWLVEYPNNFILEYNYGNLLYSLWDYINALNYYQLSIDHWDYLYAYCKKLKILKLQWKNLEYYNCKEHLLGIIKNNKVWDYNLIKWNIFYIENQYQESISEYKKYLELRKNDFYTLDALGNCFFELGDYNSAIMYYKKARSVNDKISYPLWWIARVYFTLGEFKKSIEFCEEILLMNANNFIWNYLIWRNLYMLWNYWDAKKYFNVAMKLNPNHHMCKRYLKKIEKIWI